MYGLIYDHLIDLLISERGHPCYAGLADCRSDAHDAHSISRQQKAWLGNSPCFGEESRWLNIASMSIDICWGQERIYGSKKLGSNTGRSFPGNNFPKLTNFYAPK